MGLTQRAPGQVLRRGALVPGPRLGAGAAGLLLPELGPGARGAEPLHNAQVRKRVQEKGNPLSERAGGSLIKPSGVCDSRAGAHGAHRRGKEGAWKAGWWERSEHGGEKPRGRRGDAPRTTTSPHCPRHTKDPCSGSRLFQPLSRRPRSPRLPISSLRVLWTSHVKPQSSTSAFNILQCPRLLSPSSKPSLWAAPLPLDPCIPLPLLSPDFPPWCLQPPAGPWYLAGTC